MLPFLTLDAVTATGPGDAFDLGSDPADHFSTQFVIEATPSGANDSDWSVNYVVQSSLDGETWFNIGFVTYIDAPTETGGAGDINGSASVTTVAQLCTVGNYATTDQGSSSLSPLARFVRVNITASSYLASFTASAWIAAGQPT
jgi:hypothetical protein